jgi:cation-transporting ATPase 13A1
MITGDNPLTAVHVAKEVEIVDRDVLILDVKEGTASDLVWKSVDDTISIDVDPTAPFDQKLFDQYDICVTGVALKQFEERPSWIQLVQHTWVYARVSPSQKEFILTTFKNLGFTTLMAGDGTNDVGALKQAHIGVALLDGSMEDLKKIAEHQKVERIKKVYEQQVSLSARFNQPPPPVPAAIRDQFPELVAAQQTAAANMQVARKKNPMERFDLGSITDKLADMDDGTEPPKIKLGDASCAAPFTSKLSNVSASACPFARSLNRAGLPGLTGPLSSSQSRTSSARAGARSSRPSRCTRFSRSTASSPPTRSRSSTSTASSSATTRCDGLARVRAWSVIWRQLTLRPCSALPLP